MEVIYIISTLEKANNNEYKPGKHTGSISQLESRYVTSLINPIIYFYYLCNNACDIERLLKQKLKEYRIVNLNGTVTEWVKLDLKKIIDAILDIIRRNNNKTKNSHNDTINIHENDPFHYSIYHNKKIIGNFSLSYETTCDDDHDNHDNLSVDSINILSGFEDDKFILLIFNNILNYLDTNYSLVENYIINSREINCVTSCVTHAALFALRCVMDIDDNYSVSDQKINLGIISEEISTNYIDRYSCFNDKHNKWIILSKLKINPGKWKKNNICDILLAFNRDAMSPLNEKNDEITYANEISKKTKLPLRIKYKRKFSVVKEKCYDENNKCKYYIIKVIFDKPITFLGGDSNFINDVYINH